MFRQFFGMKFNPFTKEIDSNKLFKSMELEELESRLKYLQTTRGIGLVVGEPGTGKSTALRNYVDKLNKGLYKVCYFALSTITVNEFYRGLAVLLGEDPATKKVALFNQIQKAITEYYFGHKVTPVIILDEIHMAPNGVLEDLRLLFNFQMDSVNPFILILAGQPLIRNRLALNSNTPLRQRINIKYIMRGLKKEEVEPYLSSRLRISGVEDEVFAQAAYGSIYEITKGVPRLINSLATAALMYAFSQKQRLIDDQIIYEAQKELTI